MPIVQANIIICTKLGVGLDNYFNVIKTFFTCNCPPHFLLESTAAVGRRCWEAVALVAVLAVVAGWRPFFDGPDCKKDNRILSTHKSATEIRCCVNLYAPRAKIIPLSSFNVLVRACVRVCVCAYSIYRVIH